MTTKQYKVICEIIDGEGYPAKYTLYIKEANDKVDAEYRAKHYMITERHDIDFIRVDEVIEI